MYVRVHVMKLQMDHEVGKGILKEGRRAERVIEHVWHTLLYFNYTLLLGLPTTYLCSRMPNVLATQGLPCTDLDRLRVFALLTRVPVPNPPAAEGRSESQLLPGTMHERSHRHEVGSHTRVPASYWAHEERPHTEHREKGPAVFKSFPLSQEDCKILSYKNVIFDRGGLSCY